MAGTTPYSTQGQTLRMGQQDDLVTVSDFAGTHDGDIRTEEVVAMPTDVVNVALQANVANATFADKSDDPIVYESVRENAITIPLVARRGSGSTQQPPLITMLESGGCAINSTVDQDRTTTTSTATNGFTTDDDLGVTSDLYNEAIMVKLDNEQYWPCLMNKSATATNTVTLWMDLPSAQTSGNLVYSMWTATPRARRVPVTALLTFLQNTRGAETSGAEYLAWVAKGCALGSIGTLTIEPEANGQTIWSPTFHAADLYKLDSALNVESFADTEKYLRNGGNFRFEFGTYAAGGDISSSFKELIKADIDFGLTTVPIPGTGTATSLNGTQDYMAVYQQATVTLQVIMSYADFDDVSASTFANKYMGFVWPTTAPGDPGGVGIWFPNCHQIAAPTWDGTGNYGVATLTYGADSAKNTGGTVSNSDTSQAPWAIGISTNGNTS
ncbi:MAG: hypothetical protein GY832_23710 [Chloroflexi bacterium]|nr:hypothetical protein [Chloroflexota bacterium]